MFVVVVVVVVLVVVGAVGVIVVVVVVVVGGVVGAIAVVGAAPAGVCTADGGVGRVVVVLFVLQCPLAIALGLLQQLVALPLSMLLLRCSCCCWPVLWKGFAAVRR